MSGHKRPIIGVLVNHSVIKKLQRGNYNLKGYPRIMQLVKASNESQVTLYFFALRNINLKDYIVEGTYYDETDCWTKRTFALPDVLYNRRAGGRGKKDLMQWIDTILSEKGVQKLNAIAAFDKWDVYAKLRDVPAVEKFLPITKLYEKESELIDFLDKHQDVYLKGLRGGKGQWILRIRKTPDNKYEYSYFRNELFMARVDNRDELLRQVTMFFRDRNFLIQPTINLIKLNDSKVDFRAEVQRDGHGELTIVGISARIGISQSPITIQSSAYPIEVFFKEVLEYSDAEINVLVDRVQSFLVAIYTTLETFYGRFGEIGIDFGIDASGAIWFIEPNSKSAKVSLMKAYDEKIFHRAFQNPIEFSRYISQR